MDYYDDISSSQIDYLKHLTDLTLRSVPVTLSNDFLTFLERPYFTPSTHISVVPIEFHRLYVGPFASKTLAMAIIMALLSKPNTFPFLVLPVTISTLTAMLTNFTVDTSKTKYQIFLGTQILTNPRIIVMEAQSISNSTKVISYHIFVYLLEDSCPVLSFTSANF